jgi:hypothetical protein
LKRPELTASVCEALHQIYDECGGKQKGARRAKRPDYLSNMTNRHNVDIVTTERVFSGIIMALNAR